MLGRWWFRRNDSGQIWPKDRFVRSYDGTEIRYAVLGPRTDRTVVFCSGFVCPDNFWRYLADDLRTRYRVVVWNYRGIGVSGLPREPGFHALRIHPEDLSIEANARDLSAILREEGIARAALIGHSMGVQTIFECFRQFPERVDALVAIAGPYRSPLRTFYGTDVAARAVTLGLPAMHAFPRATLLAWKALLRSPLPHPVAQHLLRGLGPETKTEDMRGFYDHLSNVDPLIAAKMIRGMHDHSAEDLLERIDKPVLILHGTRDTFTPPRVARVMAQRIPGAELVLFDGASHGLPVERPREILDRMVPFLEKAFAR